MDIAINNVFIPDFRKRRFLKTSVGIKNGVINQIGEDNIDAEIMVDGTDKYLTPGLIDCHCHIESSYLLPSLFGNVIANCGTLHCVADCHEIANVAGRKGLQFFMENAVSSSINIKFSVPSCVPATSFATSGGSIGLDDIQYFLECEEVVALGELMNIPAVISQDKKTMKMISLAKKKKKRVNGHAPDLSGEDLKRYITAGVDDDHESETYQELKEKLDAGLNVFLREGSAEKTEKEAYKIIEEYPDNVMFCTDDKSINDIFESGHINFHLRKAVKAGVSPILALKAASYNGLNYYGLNEYSEVKTGNKASLVLFNDLKSFNIEKIILEGRFHKYKYHKPLISDFLKHSLNIKTISQIPDIPDNIKGTCIYVKDGSLITEKIRANKDTPEYYTKEDILKLVVFERYGHGYSSAARIKGFGLKRGAIASSLSHDCHNIIAVGVDDTQIKRAINAIIDCDGGIAVIDGSEIYAIPLHVGGIVSDENPLIFAKKLEEARKKTRDLGCAFNDPVGTLSFMALEVIPHLKLTDRGLFDVDSFTYI